MLITHLNHTIDLNIPKKLKNWCLYLSGGTDSTILLYYLLYYMKYEKDNDITLNIITAQPANRTYIAKTSINVITTIRYILPFDEPINHHIIYSKNNKEISLDNSVKEITLDLIKSNVVDLFLTGRTRLPLITTNDNTAEKLVKTYDGADLETRINSNTNNCWSEHLLKIPIYRPFINIDKKNIFQLYKKNNLLSNLFPLTRSCSEDVIYHQFDKPCKTCWWCLERKWAFGVF